MSPCGRQREYQRKEESNMKKRLLSMVLTVIMLYRNMNNLKTSNC